uniref:Uncharacterized protein LOC102807731 n=1 Tax=Saccoglossus kowalevskii TaxID=10224 RepID=A0ABM0MA66_SACKO|nr:PREDICTED: uncharacterized protein LOC102807731 [Saccoglossus kowalevskii]
MSDWSFWETSGEDCQPVITKLDVKSGCVSIDWDLGKATSGFIERSEDKLNWTEIKTVKDKTGSYKDRGLQSQTTYYYRIRVEDDTSDGYTVSINTEGDIDSSKNEGVSCEDKFNRMLIDVSSEMGEDDLRLLKQNCGGGLIPKGILEKKTTAYDVFDWLRQRRKIRIDNTEFLEQLLRRIKRDDLAQKVQEYH